MATADNHKQQATTDNHQQQTSTNNRQPPTFDNQELTTTIDSNIRYTIQQTTNTDSKHLQLQKSYINTAWSGRKQLNQLKMSPSKKIDLLRD
jgi:hypothetical protein